MLGQGQHLEIDARQRRSNFDLDPFDFARSRVSFDDRCPMTENSRSGAADRARLSNTRISNSPDSSRSTRVFFPFLSPHVSSLVPILFLEPGTRARHRGSHVDRLGSRNGKACLQHRRCIVYAASAFRIHLIARGPRVAIGG